jgi:hypothetical protein
MGDLILVDFLVLLTAASSLALMALVEATRRIGK